LTRAGRGDEAGAIEDYRRAIELARDIQDPQAALPSLMHAARGYCALGRTDEARALADEALAIARRHPGARIALGIAGAYFRELGIADEVRDLIGKPVKGWPVAVATAAEGRLLDAAEAYAAMGAATPANELWNAHARQLVVEGRHAEAEPFVRDVVSFYELVGATSFADSARKLLSSTPEAYSDSA
jgi:tetratricopeptide (TPR) repeat protein